MQVATLFRESAKLLGASMEGSVMENSKYCMKPETQADDGYETCLDAICMPHSDRLLGGPHHFDPGMRHQPGGMDDHISHHRTSRPLMHSMKMEQYGGGGDPYSFVDEMPNMNNYNTTCNNSTSLATPANNSEPPSNQTHLPQAKKRGRRKKSEIRNQEIAEHNISNNGREEKAMDAKERKRHDRFNGLSEEEVSRRTLPDHLTSNLDVVIVGINPGMFAAFKGHHYAGPGNHFWKCLYLSGLVPEPLTADDDFSLISYGIGFTNMVARPTKGSADLTRREIKQGSQILLEKLQKFRPKIAVFNGKLIYEVFSGKKDFPFGRQSEFVEGTNTYIWVMPSSSARCAQLPRAADKVPFYMALKKFRDYLNGLISEIDESEVVFHEPKPSSRSGNTESKKPMGEVSPPALANNSDRDSLLPAKKKRGRPRKGMEKNSEEAKKAKLFKIDNPSLADKEDAINEDSSGKGGRMGEPPRKRRGRPKKVKPQEESQPNRTPSNPTPESFTERTPAGNSQGQKASSVSSGYSTGTTGSTSSDDRCRRDENGSLSNTGSNGLSPSHHSFTTQSDLSSEISAAISCGSGPPSPLNNNNNVVSSNSNNNQTEAVFDSLSIPTGQSREDSLTHRIKHNNINTIQGNGGPNHPPPPICNNNVYQSSSVSETVDQSHDQSYSQYQPPYDNRFHPLSNRSLSQNYIPSNSRDGEESSMQQTNTSYHTSYETKCLDIASKSLSGLESLVDQIPSIADAEVNGGVSGGGSSMVQDPLIPHSQTMPSLASVTSSVTHGGHYGESPSGFLPYGHHGHGAPSSYTAASHYASSPYYASELSASFPVNSLSSAYCSSTPTSSLMFGYPSYPGQYPSSSAAAGYGHSTGPSLHLSPPGYGSPSGYPSSAYSGPNPYMQGHSMTSPNSPANSQRYPQRSFHLRQDGMDLSHLGFGGF